MGYVQQIEENVKRTDFIKELEQLGATFKEGGKHTKVYLNGKQSTIPRHRELNDMLVKGIRKQLGVGG
ncbi:type II toxin-antitoxin system HicA family toxin [Acinetobacter guerrae]|uniref:type II toxin-antitoxin system HicA family toxin n=1 Tax=Acinetobacter guerrae TaxID=1843371 RepID=UPI001FD3F0E5|nr:type II toxin-antitoxin system HicA family toxin [Acinetobacter guerrae]